MTRTDSSKAQFDAHAFSRDEIVNRYEDVEIIDDQPDLQGRRAELIQNVFKGEKFYQWGTGNKCSVIIPVGAAYYLANNENGQIREVLCRDLDDVCTRSRGSLRRLNNGEKVVHVFDGEDHVFSVLNGKHLHLLTYGEDGPKYSLVHKDQGSGAYALEDHESYGVTMAPRTSLPELLSDNRPVRRGDDKFLSVGMRRLLEVSGIKLPEFNQD